MRIQFRVCLEVCQVNILELTETTQRFMQDFSVEGVHQIFGGYDFRVQERNFTIGQSPKIWGNFSKMCSKINKNVKKLLRKLETNRNCPENILIFGREMGKRRNMIWTGYIWRGSGERGRRGPQGKNSRNLFSSSLIQVDGAARRKPLIYYSIPSAQKICLGIYEFYVL